MAGSSSTAPAWRTSAGAADWQYVQWFLRQYGLELLAAVLVSTPLLQRAVARWKDRPLARLGWTVWLLAVFGLSLLALASSSFNPFIYFRF